MISRPMRKPQKPIGPSKCLKRKINNVREQRPLEDERPTGLGSVNGKKEDTDETKQESNDNMEQTNETDAEISETKQQNENCLNNKYYQDNDKTAEEIQSPTKQDDGIYSRLTELQRRICSLQNKVNKIFVSSHNSFIELTTDMTSLEFAQMNAVFAYFLASLFFIRLKLHGQDVTDHPVHRDIERIKTYMHKIAEVISQENDDHKSKLKIDKEAAKRLISFHSEQNRNKYETDSKPIKRRKPNQSLNNGCIM